MHLFHTFYIFAMVFLTVAMSTSVTILLSADFVHVMAAGRFSDLRFGATLKFKLIAEF